jgi:hypothetical protein
MRQRGDRRWGWTANAPGAWAELQFDSRHNISAGAQEKQDGPSTSVMLGYMRSYENMGDAQVDCAGCSCEPTVMNGTWESRTTLTQLHKMTVSCIYMRVLG